MAKADPEMLTKRVAIDKANAQMVATVAIAAFVTIFCLVASHAVFVQNKYQSRVAAVKTKANNQLQQNITAYHGLSASYNKFVSQPTNVLGGQTDGTGGNNGSNAVVILDALPSSYDYPALTSSLERLLTTLGLKVSNITGTDDQLNQQNNTSSVNPQPVAMPFSFAVQHLNYQSLVQLTTALQQSIRPIQVDSIDVSGDTSDLTVTISAHTYYQPGKSVNIKEQVVK